MTHEPVKNSAASVRARLLALAQSRSQDYQRVLGRYAIERFLYRLGRSPYRNKFAIKGATLFTLWTGETHRPTKDLDMLGWGSSAIQDVEETIRAICKVEDNDGILFDGESVEGTRIKEEDEYDGVHVKFHAVLAGARIPMQVDIGFGDAVYPEPEFASFPVLLPMEAPFTRAYAFSVHQNFFWNAAVWRRHDLVQHCARMIHPVNCCFTTSSRPANSRHAEYCSKRHKFLHEFNLFYPCAASLSFRALRRTR